LTDIAAFDRQRYMTLATFRRTGVEAKYGWQMWLGDLSSRLTGRMEHRAWIEIEV
jgi:hypothetical protein